MPTYSLTAPFCVLHQNQDLKSHNRNNAFQDIRFQNIRLCYFETGNILKISMEPLDQKPHA